jgi:hypothetical protein
LADEPTALPPTGTPFAARRPAPLIRRGCRAGPAAARSASVPAAGRER